MSIALPDLTAELSDVREEPTAARTGVWAIRPHQALRWTPRSPEPPTAELAAPSAASMLRAAGLMGAVAVAGMLGGVGAWALSA